MDSQKSEKEEFDEEIKNGRIAIKNPAGKILFYLDLK